MLSRTTNRTNLRYMETRHSTMLGFSLWTFLEIFDLRLSSERSKQNESAK